MKYKIQVYHDSGDSCGSNEMHTDLEFEWTDKSTVEENIRRIKEHDDFNSTCDYSEAKFDRKNTDELVESIRKSGCNTFMDIKKALTEKYAKYKSWYIPYYDSWSEDSIKLISPNGKEYTQQVFWHGYHDCLLDVSIKTIWFN